MPETSDREAWTGVLRGPLAPQVTRYARNGAPALDIWAGYCTEDDCPRGHWLSYGYRYHALSPDAEVTR